MGSYFLIGEVHGTKECPIEFLRFVINNRIRKVALEFPKRCQGEIDEFYSGERKLDDISFFKDKGKIHDGRASASVKALLSILRKQKIRVFLVDSEANKGNQRDSMMAINLSDIKGKVAFLCGNVHAMNEPLQLKKSDALYMHYPGGKVKSCGYFLKKGNRVVSMAFHAINGGKFYNFSIKDYPKDKSLSKMFLRNDLPKIILAEEGVLDSSFDLIYLINRFSYSR